MSFLSAKNVKITKLEHGFKGRVSTYNVEIFYSLNPELQFKDTESVIKSKLILLKAKIR